VTDSELLNIIEIKLEHARDDNRALGMKAYMKGQYEYFGITSPERKLIFKSIWSDHKGQLSKSWKAISFELWKKQEREFHYIAMDLIRKIERQLGPNDLDTIEFLIVNKSWWDTVDFLATHAIGQILKSDIDLRDKTIDRYINSNHMWLQRTALIFQLFYKMDTDKDLLAALIEQTFGSKEFFINKACGWALRQYSKVDPHFVREFIALHHSSMSKLTIREATKYL
jgi:3-methyladenine DNA glycosylase AlkD